MDRDDELNTIKRSGKLFQQFIMKTGLHQKNKKMRAENYNTLSNPVHQGTADTSSTGQHILLPLAFQCGQRFTNELYHFDKGICKAFGFLDLFVTLTCNPKWPDIIRSAKRNGLGPED